MPAIRKPRRRHQVSPTTIALAWLVGFRYDAKRRAYVLAVVGDRRGPVLQPRHRHEIHYTR